MDHILSACAPALLSFLTLHTALAARGVSAQWRDAVGSHLQRWGFRLEGALTVVRSLSHALNKAPQNIACASDDSLYLSDTFQHSLLRVTRALVVTPLSCSGSFKYPRGLCLSPRGKSLLVADSGTHCIKAVDLASLHTRVVVSNVLWPMDIALDDAQQGGRLLISENGHHVLRAASQGGVAQLSTLAGAVGERGLPPLLDYPQGLCCVRGGAAVICDSQNHVLLQVSPRGRRSILCGEAGRWGSSDAPPLLSSCKDVCTGKGGTSLYLADGALLREVAFPSGRVRTLCRAAEGFTFSAVCISQRDGALFCLQTSPSTTLICRLL